MGNRSVIWIWIQIIAGDRPGHIRGIERTALASQQPLGTESTETPQESMHDIPGRSRGTTPALVDSIGFPRG